eukprot:CAMPEP_0197486740 /NCGR_PEP_ID=MMETSP1311-20131121/1720_1 /TAXON_ID=464262 /ORGANISM="Genus nov. species nov., Strain RCC856" /LENGTH=80 /DNA_ID=CAMNT_0043030013 /DNA_START=8 /DNA_END=247 /DNA_ORIENTATION=-
MARAERRRAFHGKRVAELASLLSKVQGELREEKARWEECGRQHAAASRELEASRASESTPAWSELPTALWERIAGQLDEE